jgi:hypothetical protein
MKKTKEHDSPQNQQQYFLSQGTQDTNKSEDFFNVDGSNSQDYSFLDFNTQDDTASELSQPSSQASWNPEKINGTSVSQEGRGASGGGSSGGDGDGGGRTQPSSSVSELSQKMNNLQFNEENFDEEQLERLQDLPEHACRSDKMFCLWCCLLFCFFSAKRKFFLLVHGFLSEKGDNSLCFSHIRLLSCRLYV